VAVLSQTPEARGQWLEAGRLTKLGLTWLLFAVGWLLAKSLRLIGTSIAAALYAVGFVAARAVWPAICWSGRAVRLGWEQGRKPGLRAG
jgi:hypothetical protein